MKSEWDMDVVQVASIIYDTAWQYHWGNARDFAEYVNTTRGWTFDVRYGGEAPNSWTRVEGLKLSKADLDLAIKLAELWD